MDLKYLINPLQEIRSPYLATAVMCAVFLSVQTMVWLSVFGIVNVRTDVDAFDCTGGCTNTERKSTQKVDSGRKIPCRTRESTRSQYCAWLSCPAFYQLTHCTPFHVIYNLTQTLSPANAGTQVFQLGHMLRFKLNKKAYQQRINQKYLLVVSQRQL